MSAPDRGPTVVDGVIRYVSPSALAKFRACPRAWWYRYVARMPDRPQGRAAQLGVKGHARFEAAYRARSTEPLGPRERQAVERGFAPTPGAEWFHPEVCIDGRVRFGGIPLAGSVDLHAASTVSPLIVDWKYKDRLPEEPRPEALTDPTTDYGLQLAVYAWALYGDAPVDVRHVYLLHTGPVDCVAASAHFARKRAREAVESVFETHYESLTRTARSTEDDVPRCTDDGPCQAYGGCAFWARCKGIESLFDLGSTNEGGTKMGLFDRIDRDAKPKTMVVPVPEPVPVPVAEPVAEPAVQPFREQLSLPGVPVAAPEPVAEPATPAEAAVPRRRGRPRKTPVAEPALVTAPTTSGVRVYLRGVPVGRPVVQLSAYAAAVGARVLQAVGSSAEDVRLCEDARLTYGKWRVALASAAKEFPPVAGDYVYPGGDELVDAVLPVVVALAELVVA